MNSVGTVSRRRVSLVDPTAVLLIPFLLTRPAFVEA